MTVLAEEVGVAHILIVEDDADARRFFSSTLRSEGYSVSEVATVKESLFVLQERKIALALLDWYLPDGTAALVCEEIERLNQAIPVILVTGLADRRNILVDNCQIDLWLNKPTTAEKLLTAIHQLLISRK